MPRRRLLTTRPEQTDLARFWSVNPIVQWYGALRSIADANVPDIGDKARLIALAAFAASDSQISVYETKYHYNFWRPVTAIREGDADGNPRTTGDPAWIPFVVTPPYPDHSSGANNLSGAVSTILRLYFGTDEMDFAISSGAAGLKAWLGLQSLWAYNFFTILRQSLLKLVKTR